MAQCIEAFVDRNKGPDSLTEFSVEYAAGDVISLYIFLDTNFHGGNFHGGNFHGGGARLKSLGYTVLFASGRKLEAVDLFDGKRPWKAFLTQQVYDALQRSVTPNGGERKARDASEIEDLVTDDERSSIDGCGLSLHLDDAVADERSDPQDVTIAWTVLAPYLASPPPFPIPREAILAAPSRGRRGVR